MVPCTDIKLPKALKPIFPDRCVACGVSALMDFSA